MPRNSTLRDLAAAEAYLAEVYSIYTALVIVAVESKERADEDEAAKNKAAEEVRAALKMFRAAEIAAAINSRAAEEDLWVDDTPSDDDEMTPVAGDASLWSGIR